MTRFLSLIAGLAVVAAATHLNVMHSGGYGSADAPLIIALACLVAISMGAVGLAWTTGNKSVALAIFACTVSGEAYWLLTNADREMQAKAKAAEPFAAALQARADAEARVKRAEAGKRETDLAAIAEASKPGCAKNCRDLLGATQKAANAELDAANLALTTTPRPTTQTALADQLGISATKWDLALAALRSIGVLGGSLLIGLTLHGRRRAVPGGVGRNREALSKTPEALTSPKPADVAAFAAAMLFPAPGESVQANRLFFGYAEWAQKNGLVARSRKEFDVALAALCAAAELKVQNGKVLGVKLAA